MAKCEVLEKKLEQELESIEARLASGTEMTDKDLEHLDKITHTLKSLACWKDMKGEYDNEELSMSGRYVRGTSGRYGRSYSEGYSRGYSEAMRRSYPPDDYWQYR